MDLSRHQHLNWTELLQAWARSGQTPAELAQTLGLAEPTPDQEPAEAGGLFRRAEVVDARSPSSPAPCRVHLPGGAVVELAETVDPHWAAALIGALEQPA
ncbi:MAG: hypothetical protein GWO16_00750 [Gammaproteobacteria bacterium]|nr:hypothetical protein [Gammaproteobacteria bacterium]